jgi:hypothetical protein
LVPLLFLYPLSRASSSFPRISAVQSNFSTFSNIKKAMVEISDETWGRLIAAADQVHAPAEKSAVLVDVLSPDLVR